MKVPPLIINLKNIEKRSEAHEKHNKHKKHKKHKKHHKHHKHSHHHSSHSHHHPSHSHHHHTDEQVLDQQFDIQQQQQSLQPQQQPQPLAPLLHPPLLEPVELADFEEPPPIYPLPSLPSPHADTTAEPITAFEDKKPEEVNVETQQPASETPDTPAEVKQPEDAVVVVSDAAQTTVDKGQGDEVPEFVKQLKGNSRISFLRMTDDGSVTLGIIGPRKDELEDTNERILNLEQICGQLDEGIEVIPSDIDEEEIKDTIQVRPVDTIEPTPFGSYLPVHDSTFSNLTKEDTETLLEVYGSDPVCFEYAKSLQEFSSGSDYLMDIVDSVLDLLTEGRHSKEVLPIRQKLIDKQMEDKPVEDKLTEDKPVENKPTEDKATEDKPTEDKPMGDKSLEEESMEHRPMDEEPTGDKPVEGEPTVGKPPEDKPMDIEAQDAETKKDHEAEDDDDVQKQLNEIDELLNRLRDIQERRLSSSPAPIDPDAAETQLAEEITSKMTKLIKEKAKPGEICESDSVLKALGIEIK